MLQKYTITYPELVEILSDELKKNLGVDIDLHQLQFLGSYTHMLSVLGENELFYTSMLANESFLSRAMLVSSIMEHAKSLNYAVKRATPANGSVTLYIPVDEVTKFKVSPVELEFITQDNIIYSSFPISIIFDKEKSISVAYMTSITKEKLKLPTFMSRVQTAMGAKFSMGIQIPVSQSFKFVHTYILTETDIENYNVPTIVIPLSMYLPTSTIESMFLGDVEVYSSGIKCTQYSYLFEIPKATYGFTLGIDVDSLTLRLSNGVFGRAQKAGSVISSLISITMGSKGNINANSLALKTSLVDDYTGGVLMTTTKHATFANGEDGETPNTIRLNTIRSLRGQDRLSTYDDFRDLLLQNFSGMFLDAEAFVKLSDLQANETSLFVTPQIETSGLVRPLKAASGTYVVNIPRENRKVLIKQNERITVNIQDHTQTGICPFEVYYQTSPYRIKYNYTLSDVSYTPVITTLVYHSYDSKTSFQIYSVTYKYNTTEATIEVYMSVNIFTPSWYITEKEENYVPISFTEWQLRYGPETIFDVISTVVNNVDASNWIDLTYWLVDDWSTDGSIILKGEIPLDTILPQTYKHEFVVYGTRSERTEVLFRAQITSIPLKSSLEEIFPTSMDINIDENMLILYNVPIIEENEWNENKEIIQSAIFSKLFTLRDFIESRRLTTNKVTLCFNKSWGKVYNIKYNPTDCKYVYEDDSINYLDLPLKVAVEIIVKPDYDENLVALNVRNVVWEYFERIKGIHSNLVLEDLEAEVMKVDGVMDNSVIKPEIPVVYQFDAKKHVPQGEMNRFVDECIWCESPEDITVILRTKKCYTPIVDPDPDPLPNCGNLPRFSATPIAVGDNHVLILHASKKVSIWGANYVGQLGLGNLENKSEPLFIPNLNNIVYVAAGSDHSLAITEEGKVLAWGDNSKGQLGLGEITPFKHTPTEIPNLTNVAAVAAGKDFSLALLRDGTMMSWGWNFYGQLGINDANIQNVATPTRIANVRDISAIACGYYHCVALKNDGTLMSWGANENGQLGLRDSVMRYKPIVVPNLNRIVDVKCGAFHTIAQHQNGTLRAFGANNQAQLGLGDNNDRHAPTFILNVNNVMDIACGGYHTVALLSNCILRVWGGNWHGQLGTGDMHTNIEPITITTIDKVIYVACGLYHTVVLTTDGTIACCGLNDKGQLGLSHNQDKNTYAALSTFRYDFNGQ